MEHEMERTNFEKLRVYILAENLADAIWNIVMQWEHFARDTIGGQMVRAADSIGSNISEGTGRGTLQENRRFIRIARGSLYETKHWLRRAYKRKLLTRKQVDTIRPILIELSPKLNAYFRSVHSAAERSRASTKYKVQSSKLRN
jgi:four helix bundle protein